MNKKNMGYTTTEFMICLGGLVWISGIVGLIYVAVHFISKFW